MVKSDGSYKWKVLTMPAKSKHRKSHSGLHVSDAFADESFEAPCQCLGTGENRKSLEAGVNEKYLETGENKKCLETGED